MRSSLQRLEAAAERHPGIALALFSAVAALLWAMQNAAMRTALPLDGVESVCWGSRLQWGYFKHPPLAAWLAWGAARLTGYSDLAQYLLTYGSIAIGVCFVYLLAREYLAPQRAALAAMPLYFLHYYTLAPAAFCPNSIQLALQPVMAWLFLRCMRHGRLRTWGALGVVSAAAFLGKYSAGILLLAMAVSIVAVPRWRRCLATAGPWFSALLFLAAVAPHLLWLADNDFICLAYVEESIRPMGTLQRLWFPFYMLLTAVYPLLVAAALYLVAGLPALSWQKAENAGGQEQGAGTGETELRRYAVVLTAVPAAVVVLLAALGHSVQPMWLSTMASWGGLAVLLAFPWRLPAHAFLRIFRLLCLGTAIALIASTVDYMVRTRQRTHIDVGALCRAAEECMAQEEEQGGSAPQLSVVVGERWFANSLQYYHPGHPFSADIHDPLAMADAARRLKALQTAGQRAAFLLVAKRPGDMGAFLEKAIAQGVGVRWSSGVTPEAPSWSVPFQAKFGKRRQMPVYMMRFDAAPVNAGVTEEFDDEAGK